MVRTKQSRAQAAKQAKQALAQPTLSSDPAPAFIPIPGSIADPDPAPEVTDPPATAAPPLTPAHTYTLQELYPNLNGVTDHLGNVTAPPPPASALSKWEAEIRTYPREQGHGIIIPFSRRADKVSRVIKYFSDPNPAVYLLPYGKACNRCVNMSWFCFRKSPAGPCLTCRNEKDCRAQHEGLGIRMLEPAQKRMLESKGFVLPLLPERAAAPAAQGESAAQAEAPAVEAPAATITQLATRQAATRTKRTQADDTDSSDEYRPSPKRRADTLADTTDSEYSPPQKRRQRALPRLATSPQSTAPPSDAEAGPSRSALARTTLTPALESLRSSRSASRLATPPDVAARTPLFLPSEGEEELDELDVEVDEVKDEPEEDGFAEYRAKTQDYVPHRYGDAARPSPAAYPSVNAPAPGWVDYQFKPAARRASGDWSRYSYAAQAARGVFGEGARSAYSDSEHGDQYAEPGPSLPLLAPRGSYARQYESDADDEYDARAYDPRARSPFRLVYRGAAHDHRHDDDRYNGEDYVDADRRSPSPRPRRTSAPYTQPAASPLPDTRTVSDTRFVSDTQALSDSPLASDTRPAPPTTTTTSSEPVSSSSSPKPTPKPKATAAPRRSGRLSVPRPPVRRKPRPRASHKQLSTQPPYAAATALAESALQQSKSRLAEPWLYDWHASAAERRSLVAINALLPPALRHEFVRSVFSAWTNRDLYAPPREMRALAAAWDESEPLTGPGLLEDFFLRGLSDDERASRHCVPGTRWLPATLVDLALRCMPASRREHLLRAVDLTVNPERAV
ncbi:hypothetical protein Q8F55_008164 [Vanrija albida]|uniref:Zn(2)-C6 fungal-type domain-containing protein n=1 Tax=Vanrija albida TaxID=181172 RepID=A0ABR3PVK0_9TREE